MRAPTGLFAIMPGAEYTRVMEPRGRPQRTAGTAGMAWTARTAGAGASGLPAAIACAWILVSVAIAQEQPPSGIAGVPAPSVPGKASTQDFGAEPHPKTAAGGVGPFSGPPGQVYTWEDGDRTLRVRLQTDLTVLKGGTAGSRETVVAETGAGSIVRAAGSGDGVGQPVFRSDSGALMTLPGGVLLVLEAAWGKAEADAFFAAHEIALDRISELGFLPNGFAVETEPGFPSLNLANALAGEHGVELSSPNWWREIALR